MFRQCAGRAGRRGFDLVRFHYIRSTRDSSRITARKSCIFWSSGSSGQAARNVKAATTYWPLPSDTYVDSSTYEPPFGVGSLANGP